MKSTGKNYTLHEIAAMTGLTPMEVVVQFNGGCKAAKNAGVYHQNVSSGFVNTERKFVEVMDNGEINPNNVMTVTRRERYYKIVPNDGRRR